MKRDHYYFDMPQETYDFIIKKGLLKESKKERTLLDKREFVRNYLDRTYKRLNGIYGTVGQVSGMFPNNTLLITMRGHITCSKPSKYGPTIYDTFDCRDREVESVWLVN